MVVNPFESTSPLNLELSVEICQEIFFYAGAEVLADHCVQDAIPSSISFSELRGLQGKIGQEICIYPHWEIARIFHGVTTTIFSAIQTLYCDRIGRSIQVVHRIIEAMAERSGVQPISYEAIWAICIYLSEIRMRMTETVTMLSNTSWRIISMRLPRGKRSSKSRPICLRLVCVLDDNTDSVIAFRFGYGSNSESLMMLAIYDAISSNRVPSQFDACGLEWHLPKELIISSDIRTDLEPITVQLPFAITIEGSHSSTDVPSISHLLRSPWIEDIGDCRLKADQLAIIFDNYLNQLQGYGPRRTLAERQHSNRHLKAFNRDPALTFPAILCLLPTHPSVIEDGAVFYDGLHYEHELLDLWPGQDASLVRSEEVEARSWILVENEVLCVAMARELYRRDGTYRPNRPGR